MSTAKEVKYLFIDGACLDDILTRIGKEFFNGEKIELRYERLAEFYDKVFYYDALPHQKKGESNDTFNQRLSEKENFLNELKLLDKFHVYEGVVFERKEKLTQKAVDIMIAVDMLRHSFRRNMNRATLLTGDMDFKPLVDALIQEGMFTTILFDPRNTSKELLYASDSNQVLSLTNLYNYATNNFREKYPVPKLSQIHRSEMQKDSGFNLTKQGVFNNEQILLYFNGTEYTVIFKQKNNPNIIGTFNNEEYLLKWVEYEYNGKIIWKK